MLFVSTGLIFFFASVLRGILGFTTSLFVIPALLHLGYSLPQCVTLMLSVSLVQSFTGVRRLRKHIPWNEVRQATIWRLLALPVGVLCVSLLDDMTTGLLKNAVGVFILTVVFIQLFGSRLIPQRGFFRQASLLSGFLLGSLGTGGAPMVLWTVAQDWDSQKARAFYFSISLFCVPVGLVGLLCTFGSEIWTMLAWGMAYTPLVILAANIGVHLGNDIPRDRMRGAALILLTMGALLTLNQ